MYDALVIGAGPAGSTAARLLAEAGWSVALVEKSTFPRRKVCGEFISATSLPLLFDSAAKDAFLAEAGPEVRRVGLFAADAVAAAPMPAARNPAAGFGRALGRERLDTLLLEAAVRAGATLIQPAKVIRLQRSRNGHECTIAMKNRAQDMAARLIIAANGSWERSPVLPPDRPKTGAALIAFKAHFRSAGLPPDLMPLVLFPGGYGGMVHADEGRVSLSCCIRRDTLLQCRAAYPGSHAGEAVLKHILGNCEGVRRALEPARRDGSWLSAGPIRPGVRTRYWDGIFFAGNAAGEAHPIIAEGISMAMQASWLLCRILIEGAERSLTASGMAELGRIYSRQWNAAFSSRVHAAALLARLALWPATARLFPVIARSQRLLTIGAQWSGKTKRLVG